MSPLSYSALPPFGHWLGGWPFSVFTSNYSNQNLPNYNVSVALNTLHYRCIDNCSWLNRTILCITELRFRKKKKLKWLVIYVVQFNVLMLHYAKPSFCRIWATGCNEKKIVTSKSFLGVWTFKGQNVLHWNKSILVSTSAQDSSSWRFATDSFLSFLSWLSMAPTLSTTKIICVIIFTIIETGGGRKQTLACRSKKLQHSTIASSQQPTSATNHLHACKSKTKKLRFSTYLDYLLLDWQFHKFLTRSVASFNSGDQRTNLRILCHHLTPEKSIESKW